MPDITATAGDLIEIRVAGQSISTLTLLAKIMTRDVSGKWQIELAGEPPMRGVVAIESYIWASEDKCWKKRGEEEGKVLSPLAKAVREQKQVAISPELPR